MSSSSGMGVKRAREVLRLSPFHTTTELRRAFREAAKRAHPDRKGGDAERFREVVEAFRLLQAAAVERAKADHHIIQPPVPARPAAEGGLTLAVSPRVAFEGGQAEHGLPDGRRIRLTLPAGLRAGDTVRAGEALLTVAVRGDGEMMVRGDDLWITVPVDPRLLAEGGRIAIETPLGRRVVWITKKAGERGLVRLVGQGLPARAGHRLGHLFLRLTPQVRETHSAARTLLRRFAAAWAA
jgi:curved DNA-binding protein